MSHTHTTSSSSDFQSIFNTALREYQAKTRTDLQAHPLATQLRNCDSPTAILAVLQDIVRKFDQRRNSNMRLTKCLNTTVNVLHAICPSVGTGVSSIFPHAKVIFTGIGVLLLAAKEVHASQAALIDLLERVENFLRRLECYTEIPSTGGMTDMIVKVMVQVLSILAIATKDITQRHITRYVNKLFGGKDIEDALHRLDKLTQDEARIAIAENLKVTHEVKEQVIDDHKEVKEVVQQSVERTRVAMQETIDGAVDEIVTTLHPGGSSDLTPAEKRRQEIRRWLSPPDPSTNHNIARATHHVSSAAWFFEDEDSAFNRWKSTSSLLWINGKPGSGKSVLCSSMIEHVMALRDAGLASMAYFYFDFRDENKRNRNKLLRSLLFQLSTQSDRFSILSRLHLAHEGGKQQPSDVTMTRCLKEMVSLQAQDPLYLIVDAVDECPDNSGMPSAREQVLELIADLVGLRIPNLHMCVTSRPEVDIRTAFKSLTILSVSLHEQSGQNKDIIDYINSVVYSDTKMRRWREEDKRLVVETLSEKADGMFRWVYCQLESLRHCLPPSVRHILGELPKTLDETYERILGDINEANREHAHRLLQCLTVAVRPLHVNELAEVLGVDFDAAQRGGIPTVNTNWQWDDQQQAILSTCSSLIAIVDRHYDQVVQFSHFSVKEFLTSERLAHPIRDVSRYHIPLHSAHATLAQACLAVLLHLDDFPRSDIYGRPLCRYAADYWDVHVRSGNASSSIQNTVKYFLDRHSPWWGRWRQIGGRRGRFSEFYFTGTIDLEEPLFYAAYCGLHDIAQHLIAKYPQDVNPRRDRSFRPTPLHAALMRKEFHVAQLLYDHGADINTPLDIAYTSMSTLLHHACCNSFGDVILAIKILQWLFNHGAKVNMRDSFDKTPLHIAAEYGCLDIVRILIRHNADIDARDRNGRGKTPLVVAAAKGHVEIVRTLIEHKANVNVRDIGSWAKPYPSGQRDVPGTYSITHGVKHNFKLVRGETPLHMVVGNDRSLEIAQMLLEHHANINSRDNDNNTPLHVAVHKEKLDMVRMLLEHNANVNAKSNEGDTPLHTVIDHSGNLDIVRMLLEHNANVNTKCKWPSTPLHDAVYHQRPDIARMLIEHNANVNAKARWGITPLHIAAMCSGESGISRMLIEHNANVDAKDTWGSTPLHWATMHRNFDHARILLEHNANANVRDSPRGLGFNPWHKLSAPSKRYPRSVFFRLAYAKDGLSKTPLDMALEAELGEFVKLLREHGAK